MDLSQYVNLLENVSDGIYFVDPDRRITYWNKAAENITGYAAAEVIGSRCADNLLIHVDQRGRSLCRRMCPLAKSIRDGRVRQSELFLHHKQGHRVPVNVRVLQLTGPDGQVIGGAELFFDTSGRRAMRQRLAELERLAMLDPLTQLPNRHHIAPEIESRLQEMQRHGIGIGVLFLDIDHFKQINDTHGHPVGDRVLQTVANTLKGALRPFDLIGRWGGEEFVGLVRNVNAAVLATVAERLRALVAASHIRTAGRQLTVTISVGATLAQTKDSPESVVKRADRLMYASKQKGRNHVSMDGEKQEPRDGARTATHGTPPQCTS